MGRLALLGRVAAAVVVFFSSIHANAGTNTVSMHSSGDVRPDIDMFVFDGDYAFFPVTFTDTLCPSELSDMEPEDMLDSDDSEDGRIL